MSTTTLPSALTGSSDLSDSPRQIIARALAITIGSVLILFTIVLFVVPKLNNGAALTVLSGSMSPALDPGDIIVVKGVAEKEVCQELKIGDIVTYFPESGSADLITHRVKSKQSGAFDDGTNCRLITQGDANNSPDDALVTPEQVRGKFMYGVPKVGWARDWMLANKVIALVVLGVAVAAYYAWPNSRGGTRVVSLGGGGQLMLDGAGSGQAMLLGGGPTLAPGNPKPPGAAGPAGGQSPHDAQRPLSDSLDFELRVRELLLRERELRLRESEAAHEFGYVPPRPLPCVLI